MIVELTPDGIELARRAVLLAAEKESVVVSELSPRERDQLNGYLRRLMLVFEAQERARGER